MCPIPELYKDNIKIDWVLNGKRIVFECNPQYHPVSGDAQMDCQPNGTWIGKPMKCGCMLCIIYYPVSL